IAKVSGEIITISHLSEARRGKQVRTRHVRVYPRPRWMDSYASDPAANRLSPGFVAPGDPGNPAWQSDFDRAVQANQHNGGGQKGPPWPFAPPTQRLRRLAEGADDGA